MDNGKVSRVCRPYHISESSKIFHWSHQSVAVLQGLNEQRLKSQFCDVVLLADDQSIPAHRALLALSSQYFNAMFTLGMKEEHQVEVELVGLSSIGLRAVVDFLYCAELRLDGGNIDYVLEAAHLLQVWQVVDFCCQYLEQEVTEDNYLYLQELALLYSLDRLDTFIDHFILSRFGTLSFTPDFMRDIPLHKLTKYLSSSQVEHESEQALLQAAFQWLSQSPERTAHAPKLLSHIRLALMPVGDLVGWVLPAIRSLLPNEAQCEALVEEALAYHATPSAQPLFQTGLTSLRDGVEITHHILFSNVCRLDAPAGVWKGASMNQRRVDFFLGAVGDCLIAVGGRNDTGAPAEDSWCYVAGLPRYTYGHAGTVHRGVVYISGGHDYQIGPYRKEVLSYEPSGEGSAWVERPSMSEARGWHCMASVDHLIYAIGGSDDHAATTERFDVLQVEAYDSHVGQWSYVAPLLLPNSEAGVAVWTGKIYVLGGYSWEGMVFSKATQVYDPDKGAWYRGPDLPKRIAGASACVCTVRRSCTLDLQNRKKKLQSSQPT
uniref:Kelch-like protein 36 n=1 Tax=Periophthalmus magnuspinnatus TaxID=409849 RepID=A0A3B3ZCV2_9GOBI